LETQKSDICVIFARNYGWLRNWGPGAKLGEGLCPPRPRPETATGPRVHPMASFPGIAAIIKALKVKGGV